jgi:hypothetical protein
MRGAADHAGHSRNLFNHERLTTATRLAPSQLKRSATANGLAGTSGKTLVMMTRTMGGGRNDALEMNDGLAGQDKILPG